MNQDINSFQNPSLINTNGIGNDDLGTIVEGNANINSKLDNLDKSLKELKTNASIIEQKVNLILNELTNKRDNILEFVPSESANNEITDKPMINEKPITETPSVTNVDSNIEFPEVTNVEQKESTEPDFTPVNLQYELPDNTEENNLNGVLSMDDILKSVQKDTDSITQNIIVPEVAPTPVVMPEPQAPIVETPVIPSTNVLPESQSPITEVPKIQTEVVSTSIPVMEPEIKKEDTPVTSTEVAPAQEAALNVESTTMNSNVTDLELYIQNSVARDPKQRKINVSEAQQNALLNNNAKKLKLDAA